MTAVCLPPAGTPSETWHPSEFIREELKARGWTMDVLAVRMGGDFGSNRLSLDLYFEVGPNAPNLMLGPETAEQLGKAFRTSADYWRNLHIAWRRSLVAVVTPPRAEGQP